MSAGTAFHFGWSASTEADKYTEAARIRRLAATRFTMHADPYAAARATVSLRTAYPWLDPSTAAQMGAFGVDPADTDVAEVAGIDLARQARRGYAQPGQRRNVNEVRNVRAPLWNAMDTYAAAQEPATAQELGIPTGTGQDYANAIAQQNRTTRGQRGRIARRQPGELAQLHPELADQFNQNAATLDAARQIQADPDFYSRQSEVAPDPGVSGMGATFQGDTFGETASGAGVDASRNQVPEGVDVHQARALAGTLPSMDATLRHIRLGGETVQGIPIPSGNIPADALRDVLLGPDRNDIATTLQAEADRLTAGPHATEPATRARIDGINQALDLIAGDRQSIGPDVQVGGFDLNIGDVGDRAAQITRGTIRGATVAMDSVWQAGQARFRQIVSEPRDVGNWAALNPIVSLPSMTAAAFSGGRVDPLHFGEQVGETDLGIALENLANGRDLRQGGGFFVNPNSPDAQERRRRELEHGSIGGHVITMGRQLASSLGAEPDTLPFQVVSGLTDLAWQIADPGGALVDAAARSPRTAAFLAHAGGLTATRSVHPARFAEWVAGSDGQRVLNFYAGLDPEDALAIDQARPRSMPEWAHWQLADGNVGDTGYVEEMLRNITGMGLDTPSVPTARAAGTQPAVAWRQRTNTSRWMTDTPATGAQAANIYDIDQVAEEARSSMRNMRVPEAEVSRIVGRIYREGYEVPTRVRIQQIERELDSLSGMDPAAVLPSGGTVAERTGELTDTVAELRPGLFITAPTPRRQALHDIWFGDMQEAKRQALVDHGVEGMRADQLTSLREVGKQVDGLLSRQMAEDGAYWLRVTAEDEPANRRVWGTIGGEGVNDASSPSFAHIAAEHQLQHLPLEEDYRQLARLTQAPVVKWLNSAWANPQSGQSRGYASVLEHLMNKVWKPSRLIRLAWPIRVVGEEGLRLGAAGMTSPWNHPLSYWAIVAGKRNNALGETPWEEIASHVSAMNRRTGGGWLIPGVGSGGRFEGFAYRRYGTAEDGIELTPGYGGAWADGFARMHSDGLGRRVARILNGTDSEFSTIDDFIEAGGGHVANADELRLADDNIIARTRADLIDSHPELANRGNTDYLNRLANGDEAVHTWDDYVQSYVARIREMTGGHDDLVEAIATGRMPGRRRMTGGVRESVSLDLPNTNRVNPAAVRALERDYAHVAPEIIGGDAGFNRAANGVIIKGSAEAGLYDRAMERAYTALGALPTDVLSRHPAWTQFFWRRATELAPYMDEASQARLLQHAVDGKLTRGPLAKLSDAVGREMPYADDQFHIRLSAYIGNVDDTLTPTLGLLRDATRAGHGDLGFDEAVQLASHAALDNTRWLLYDVHKRGQFMDALRMVFPFGEAWKEVGTRWLALTARRPGTVISRSRQIAKLAGNVQPWEDVAGPDGDPSQHGFLFENSTGETVFTYPAAEWFTSALTGVPVELTGSLNGLTLMNSVLPGVGPVIQVPASFSQVLRESPEYDTVRDLLFPFGMATDPTASAGGAGSLISEQIFSSSVRRMFQGIAAGGLREIVPFFDRLGPVADVTESVATLAAGNAPRFDRLFMNSVFDTMRYNVSTGDYSTDTQANVNRLIRDSTRTAGALTFIRGLAGFAAPSSPIPEFQVEDKDGSLLMLRAMSDIYRDLQAEDYTTAPQVFLERYGDNLSLLLQAKSVPRSATLPVTEEADRWLRNHEGFEGEYPETYGLWVPGNEGDDATFDYDAYGRAIRNGASETLGGGGLDPEDLVRLANNRAGSIEYRRIEQELLDTPGYATESGNLTEQGQRYLSTVVTPALRLNYLGFGATDLHRGPATEDLQEQGIDEARRAARDRRIPAPLRHAVRDYLQVHDQTMETARDPNGYDASTYYDSQGTEPLRDYLRYTVAPAIREDLPEEYRGRWDVIWDRLFDRIMLQPGEEPKADEQRAAA